jgi:hypothetical protein
MANVMRHRYGAKNPVLAEVESATVIEIGDLVCLKAKYAVNANAAWASAAVASAADNFLGVAMQASATGETTPIRVATSGTFEYPCDSASVYLGFYAEFDDSASSLEDQSVNTAAAKGTKTIGMVLPNNTGGVGGGSKTSCLVRIWSNRLGVTIDGN